jgi:hypothetical protein
LIKLAELAVQDNLDQVATAGCCRSQQSVFGLSWYIIPQIEQDNVWCAWYLPMRAFSARSGLVGIAQEDK